MTIREACEGIHCTHFVDVRYNKYCDIIGLVGNQDLRLYLSPTFHSSMISLKLKNCIQKDCPHINKLKLIAGLIVV